DVDERHVPPVALGHVDQRFSHGQKAATVPKAGQIVDERQTLEFLLHGLPLGNIAQEGVETPAVGVLQGPDHELDGDLRAVLAQGGELEAQAEDGSLPGGEEVLQSSTMCLALVGWDENL